MNKQEYKALMAEGEAGTKLTQEVFDELKAFAQAKRAKQPSAEWVLTAPVKTPKVKAEPKVKAPKAKCDPSLHGSDEACDKDSRSDGVCAAHYSRLVYRKDEAKAERVREASRRYAEKQRKAKAEAAAHSTAA